jgi:arsenate reductase
MKKIYHLSNCGTCQKIIAELGGAEGFVLQDIKTEPITAAQLDAMQVLAGSYEALFSRKAMKYKSMGLAAMTLSEDDYRRLILEEYTFLKRPVILIGEQQFVGNAPKTVAAAKAMLSQS